MKAMENEGDGDTSCNWCIWNNHQRHRKRYRDVGNWRMSRDRPNYSIVNTGQNIEESPGDLRRLAVAQSPVKDHQLTLGWKTQHDKNGTDKPTKISRSPSQYEIQKKKKMHLVKLIISLA